MNKTATRKAATPRVRKITDLRKQLDIIDEWLCGPTGVKLGQVLSALRGPDTGDPAGARKRVTTEVIRTKAFPKLKALDWTYYGNAKTLWNMADPATKLDLNAAIDPGGHFHNHIRLAAKALGLL
jgi:hypothetical protein